MNLTNRHMIRALSSDSELMEEISLGRKAALRQIIDRYMAVVSRTAYRILCDRPDSENVTRKVFMKIWKNASSYDGGSSVQIWIYKITYDLCMECLRMRRILDYFSIRPSVYEASAPDALSPEEDFITKETWAVFCRASLGLSPKQRAVFAFNELEGLSVSDTAAITGMTKEQVRSHMNAAAMKVRHELERYGKVR